MRQNKIHFCFSLIFSLIIISLQAQDNNNKSTTKIDCVVIDAGHGGKDPGALGKYSREKNIALAIALKTGEYIEKNLPDVKVVYTRKKDKLIPLYQRAKIANDAKAKFFISIHCNSTTSPQAYGTETFVMGLHKNQANLEVAKKENSAILNESNMEAYDGFDPNSPDSYIIFSLFQNEFMDSSLSLADKIQREFKTKAGRRNRGVKQAGFLVLHQTVMPGVLVEAGFLSNPKEEKFLNSKRGQALIASGIYRAFKQYKQELEKKIDAIEDASKGSEVVSNNKSILYRVQFLTRKKEIPTSSSKFKKLKSVWSYKQGKVYKYTAGKFQSFTSADKYKAELQKKGYKDAFVAAFKEGKRIPIEEAKTQTEN
ncbi:MAG: N-acetylmuramoyl-L-alanine amidase [Hyphomicrobiales bacterium]